MFPVPKTKTIGNFLEILVGDWKYSGTLTISFTTLSLSRHLTPFGLEFAMKNIMYILVTHLCMYKKIFSWGSYILQRAVTGMEKQVRVKYRVSGPSKTPSENTHIFDKAIHQHKCTQMYRVFFNQTTKCSWLTSSPEFSIVVIF